MVELIVGKKGKGKTKVLLDKVNGAIKEANGSIVYLDKSAKHMYELNNKVRLIDVSGYPIKNADEFVGFVCGIISQDHDLEQIYLDSFLKVSKLEDADVTDTLDQLDKIGEKYGISIVVSISLDKEEIPEAFAYKIVRKLQKAGIVDVERGASGGCRVGRGLSELTLYDVVTAVDEEPVIMPCLRKSCSRNTGGSTCKVHVELAEIQRVLVRELKARTLSDLF